MLCSFTLSKLHPLLGYAVDLEGTDYIKSTLTPAQMHLPSEMMSLRLEPLRVSSQFVTPNCLLPTWPGAF